VGASAHDGRRTKSVRRKVWGATHGGQAQSLCCELTVAREEREMLDPRLSYQHAIEGVAMVEREGPDLLDVL
jgi:hypothetical protein